MKCNSRINKSILVLKTTNDKQKIFDMTTICKIIKSIYQSLLKFMKAEFILAASLNKLRDGAFFIMSSMF
jgi:hypothetical protein